MGAPKLSQAFIIVSHLCKFGDRTHRLLLTTDHQHLTSFNLVPAFVNQLDESWLFQLPATSLDHRRRKLQFLQSVRRRYLTDPLLLVVPCQLRLKDVVVLGHSLGGIPSVNHTWTQDLLAKLLQIVVTQLTDRVAQDCLLLADFARIFIILTIVALKHFHALLDRGLF